MRRFYVWTKGLYLDIMFISKQIIKRTSKHHYNESHVSPGSGHGKINCRCRTLVFVVCCELFSLLDAAIELRDRSLQQILKNKMVQWDSLIFSKLLLQWTHVTRKSVHAWSNQWLTALASPSGQQHVYLRKWSQRRESCQGFVKLHNILCLQQIRM